MVLSFKNSNINFGAPQTVTTNEHFSVDIFLHRQHYVSPSRPVLEELDEYYDRSMEAMRKKEMDERTKAGRLKNMQQGREYYFGKIRETSREEFAERYKNMCTEIPKTSMARFILIPSTAPKSLVKPSEPCC